MSADRSPSLPSPSASGPRDESTGLDPALPGAETPEKVFAAVRKAGGLAGAARERALAETVPRLARLLECPAPDIRSRAASSLYGLTWLPATDGATGSGASAADAINARMSDPAVLSAVYECTRADGQGGARDEAAPLVVGLASVLRTGATAAMRDDALGALLRFHGAALAPAVPVLAATLSDPGPGFRRYAALALSFAEVPASAAAEAVPRVIAALARPAEDAQVAQDADTPEYLLKALRSCGTAAAPEVVAPAVAAAEPFLSHPVARVAVAAAEFLVAVGAGRRAVPYLTALLRGEAPADPGMAPEHTAAEILARAGPEGLDALRAAVASAGPSARSAAAKRLAQADPAAGVP
jgi:hypothetical protein